MGYADTEKLRALLSHLGWLRIVRRSGNPIAIKERLDKLDALTYSIESSHCNGEATEEEQREIEDRAWASFIEKNI